MPVDQQEISVSPNDLSPGELSVNPNDLQPVSAKAAPVGPSSLQGSPQDIATRALAQTGLPPAAPVGQPQKLYPARVGSDYAARQQAPAPTGPPRFGTSGPPPELPPEEKEPLSPLEQLLHPNYAPLQTEGERANIERTMGREQAQDQATRDEFANRPAPTIRDITARGISAVLEGSPSEASPAGGGFPLAQGVPNLVRGVKNVVAGENKEERYKGGAQIVAGTMDELMPAFAAGLIEKPLAVGSGLISGALTAKGAQLATKAAGGSKEAQDLAESLGFAIPAIVGLNVDVSTVKGQRGAIISGFGGKVAVGAAEAPEGGVKVGAKFGERRGGTVVGAPESAPAGPTIKGEPGAVSKGEVTVNPDEVTPVQRHTGDRALSTPAGVAKPAVAPQEAQGTPSEMGRSEIALRKNAKTLDINLPESLEAKWLTDNGDGTYSLAARPRGTDIQRPVVIVRPGESPEQIASNFEKAHTELKEQNAKTIASLAKEQQPHVVAAAQGIADQVHGAKVVDPGAKPEESVKRKLESGRDLTDLNRAQVVVPDEATPIVGYRAGEQSTKERLDAFKAQGMTHEQAMAADKQKSEESARAILAAAKPGEVFRPSSLPGAYHIVRGEKGWLLLDSDGRPVESGVWSDSDVGHHAAGFTQVSSTEAKGVIGKLGAYDKSIAGIPETPMPTPKEQAIQAIKEQLPTHEVEPIKADNLPIVAAKLPNAGEIQVATQQEHDAQAATHPIYQAQQEALARGDEKEAARLGEELEAKQKELTQPTNTALPRDLAQSKPRYGYGARNYPLQFDDPRDLAAYTVTQATPNKAHDRFMDYLRGQYPDDSDAQIVQRGRGVRDRIKGLAKAANSEPFDNLTVPATEKPNGAKGETPNAAGLVTGEVAVGKGSAPANVAPEKGEVKPGETGDPFLLRAIESEIRHYSPEATDRDISQIQHKIMDWSASAVARGEFPDDVHAVTAGLRKIASAARPDLFNGDYYKLLDQLEPVAEGTGNVIRGEKGAVSAERGRIEPAPTSGTTALKKGTAVTVDGKPGTLTYASRQGFEKSRVKLDSGATVEVPHKDVAKRIQPVAPQGAITPELHENVQGGKKPLETKKIMGIESGVVQSVDGADGMKYELYTAVGPNDTSAIVVTDKDSGHVATLKQFKTFAQADNEFNATVAEASVKGGEAQGVTSGTPGHEHPKPGAIAWDLDKTLAHYEDGDAAKNPDKIGAPIPENVALAKQQIKDGKDVWIYTARAETPEAVTAIKAWTKEHLGVELPVTNVKHKEFGTFYDDRGVKPPAEQGGAVAETKPGEPVKTAEKPFKYGSTQANIAHGSDASNAIIQARNRISDGDLAGKGKDVGGEHVTVRYGIKSEDTAGVKKYLASLQPFEATLGKTDSFPPSEHSDGAAVIIAPIEAPELHKINAELEKHGDFTEPSFKEYAPHATLAYVKPEAAPRYTGMALTEGKTFTVNEIAITNREGVQEVVPLKGEPLASQRGNETVPQGQAAQRPEREGGNESAPGEGHPAVVPSERGKGHTGEAAVSGGAGAAGTQEEVGPPEYTSGFSRGFPVTVGDRVEYRGDDTWKVTRISKELPQVNIANKDEELWGIDIDDLDLIRQGIARPEEEEKSEEFDSYEDMKDHVSKGDTIYWNSGKAREMSGTVESFDDYDRSVDAKLNDDTIPSFAPIKPLTDVLRNRVTVTMAWELVRTKPMGGIIQGEAGAVSGEKARLGAAGEKEESLSQHLLGEITDGNMPKDNPALKKMVEEYDGKPADPARMKQAQESLEVAITQQARKIIETGEELAKATRADMTRPIFEGLVKLYESQPNLNVRTSTSIENQAYSTPAPLAYVADKLAGIDKSTTVYEPTAGNGMLLIAADPKNVTANELNADRIAGLREQGFKPIQGDALITPVRHDSFDAVIANPPFGSLKDANGKPTKERVDGYKIGQIDHMIAARALDAMKDDGKATLILGANMHATGGQSTDDRIFLNWLYSRYNVVGHFEVDGRLYGRQGAAWPVRVITIDGRQQSAKIAPAPGTIERVATWDSVYDQLSKGLAAERPARSGAGGAVSRPATADDQGSIRGSTGAPPARTDRGGPGESPAATDEQPRIPARADRDRPGGESEGLAEPNPTEPAVAEHPEPDELEERGEPEGKPERAAKPRSDSRNPLVPSGNDFQVAYQPTSSNKDENVLIPVNMKQPLQQAMDALEDAVGDIDKFVAKELGYKSIHALHDAFMGLQVDAIAAAIHQIKLGKAVIIADQTGIGKGRTAAGIIRWTIKQGNIPVFMSAKPELFTAMYEDLADIGTDNVRPFIVNLDESITLPSGKKAFTNKPGIHRRLLERITGSPKSLPNNSNAVFLTYSQINTPNLQQSVLRNLAPNSVFILDESHNAGGASNTGEYMQSLLGLAKGVTYLSATYAKRPDNMPVYFKTDMGEAIGDSGTLIDAMSRGGLPLQTVVSHNLVKAGQMFRRERSFDGISMGFKTDTENHVKHAKMADATTEALRAIVEADKSFHDTYVQAAQDEEDDAASGQIVAGGGNQAANSVTHGEFTSVVHNFVRQMLLGIKADTAADDAIAALRRGEKPMIAVDNTMGSFLQHHVADSRIAQGEALGDFDYRTVLSRALDRSRYITITDPMGDKTKHYVPLEKLDPKTKALYDKAQKIINGLKSDIPVSPIDWMRQRIENAGYTVAEITGRNLAVNYSNPDRPTLSTVPSQEQNDKVETTQRFNDGRLDALIGNVSASTGISLHASEKFKDQKSRHMIVAQPAQDINIFMQMLGRINRTGQKKLPIYTILNADLPAEKRPSALLSKKMKSLNANTSSNTESATSVKAADMMNKYGDQIIGNYLAENPDLARVLDVDPLNDHGEPTPDIARKATGRLALLPVKAQEAFYRDVEQQYNDYIAYLDSTNQNELDPKTFDYDAQELKQDTLTEGTNKNSPFGEDSIYGEYSIKAQKPLTTKEVTDAIQEHLGGKTEEQHNEEMLDTLEDQYTRYIQNVDPEHAATLANASIAHGAGRSFIRDHQIGSTWRIEINGDVYSAAVTNIRSTHKGHGNPFALSKIMVNLATAGPLRNIAVPATQMNGITVASLYDSPTDIFRTVRPDQRETAKIVTGNLLAAFGELTGTRTSIINFTKHDGTTEQGILLPKNFSFSRNTRGDYRMRDSAHALRLLKNSINPRIEDMGIQSRDQNVRVVNEAGQIKIITPKAKARGGKYFLDQGLRDIVGDFVSQQNTMRATVPAGKETQALDAIMRKTALYAPPSMADEAKSVAPAQEGGAPRVVPGARSSETGNETGRSPLQDLTDTINRQVGAKAPIKEKLEIGAKVGAAKDSVTGAVGEAYGRLKGMAAALWDAYKNPRQSILLPRGSESDINDYERAVGHWSGADNVSAREIHEFRKANQKAVPDQTDRNAISIYTEAGGDQAKLREWAKNIAANPGAKPYAKSFQRAAELSNDLSTIANNVATHNDSSLERAQEAGILREGVENYMMHVWKDNPRMLAKVRAQTNWASLQTKPSFSKQRTIPTYYDGIMSGFTPQNMGFDFLTAVHERALQEAIAARAFIRSLQQGRAADGRPLVVTSAASARQLPEEEGRKSQPYMIRPNTKPNEDYADYRTLDHPALRGWRWAGEDQTGNPMFVQGDMLVHPEIFRHLKNNLTKSAIRSYSVDVAGQTFHPGKATLDLSNFIKSSVLVGSRFHETQEELIAAQYRENPFNLVKLDLSESWQRELVDGGLMVANYDGQMDFSEGLSGEGLKAIPGIGPLIHGYNDYLFKEKIPALKMTVARDVLARNLDTYKHLSREKVVMLTAKEVNTAFGGLNYKLLGRNRTVQDALRLILLAPDFAESRAKFAGQAIRPQGRQQLLNFLFGGLVMFTIAQVVNELINHKIHPETPFGVHYKGKVYQLRSPEGDAFRAITDPGGFITGKENTLLEAVQTLAKSHDDYGKPISFKKRLEAIARRDVPIPVQSFTEKPTKHHHSSTGRKFLEMLAKIGGLQVTNEQKKH